MTLDWSSLDAELAMWTEQGLTLPVWWRDDDAVAPTAALGRLTALSDQTGLNVHLAIIPSGATPALVAAVRANPTLIPVVHGWAHRNHAPLGEKKAEFGAHRPTAAALEDARAGLERLTSLFGDSLRQMFVPPWNRIAPEVVIGLPALGYTAMSTFTPRKAAMAAPGLACINTHLDPIDWKGSRSLVAPDRLIAQIAGQLADRREGRADNAEPYGLLTHHLAHDDAIWEFMAALVTRLMAGPVRPWIAATKKDLTL
ncbi:polysaccharide deacetylase family protein [Phaeobacter marinintestinus]|uniref:polysaccharide deacetylase family protein n=1 Tax=Falsiphaeobacter marinintestinus TaxID=1492905 RepID=UPI0011B6D8DB|nr:polysaccharide deacetylase family protein [Phaeobacter marinintestinus]